MRFVIQKQTLYTDTARELNHKIRNFIKRKGCIKEMKVAVLGAGGISGAHVPSWQRIPEAELVAICDVMPDRLEKYKDTGARLYESCDEMFEKEEIDILDICLPTFLHADFAVKAMEKGINVICEKPISLDINDVDRVYATAEKNNVKFMIAHVVRFWPEFVFLRNAFLNETYGKMLTGHIIRLGSTPRWSWENWMRREECSGLVPFDLHIHDLDFIVYTFGAPVNCITHRSQYDNQDIINATYEFENGTFLTCDSWWVTSDYPFTFGYRFTFEKGVIELKDGKLMVYPVGADAFEVKAGEEAEGEAVINLPATDAYFEEIRYFADCVLQNKPADIIKPQELKTVLELMENFKK